MDLTESITPKSDQLNADDLISGPVTVTIESVTKGSAEQPINVNLLEYPGRAYRPSKSMRRVMVFCWGAEASTYTGRRLTLYRNPDIAFGGVKVGGIEISALNHIEKAVTVALTTTRGRRKDFTVKPLPVADHATPTRDWLAELELAGDNIEAIAALGSAAAAAKVTPATLTAIRARYTALNNGGAA
jgi:hypothetical protein